MAAIRARNGAGSTAVLALIGLAVGLLLPLHPSVGAIFDGAPAEGVLGSSPTASCPAGQRQANQPLMAYSAHTDAASGSGLPVGRTASLPATAAAPARLTVNKLRSYYRGISGRDLGQELVVAATCPTAPVAADPAAERAVSAYRAQVRQHASALVPQVQRLVEAVLAGDRGKARSRYRTARAHWEQVRAVVTPTTAVAARERWDRVGRLLGSRSPLAVLAPVARRLLIDARAAQVGATTAPLSLVTIGRIAKELFDDDPADAAVLRAEVDSAWAAYNSVRPLASDQELVVRLDAAFRTTRRELSARRGQDTAQRRDLARLADALAAPLAHLAAAV